MGCCARALECARRAEQTLQQWAAAQVEVKAISEDATRLRSSKALELRDSIPTDWSRRLHGRLADAEHSLQLVRNALSGRLSLLGLNYGVANTFDEGGVSQC